MSIRVDMRESKRSIKSRVDRGTVIGASIGTSTLCQQHPEVQAACSRVVQAAADLEASDKATMSAEAALEVARAARDHKQVAYDNALSTAAAVVEQTATSEPEVVGAGLVVLERASYAIAAPASVTARWDAVKGQLVIRIKPTPGMTGYVVDISPDPIGPSSWQRLPGIATTARVSGLQPGLYWVRAAGVKGSEQSEFTAPVSVMVKAV